MPTTKRLAVPLVAAIVLAACGGQPATEAPVPAPEVQASSPTPAIAVEVTSAANPPPAATAPGRNDPALDLANLPEVPLVELPGDSWFQPTPPGQIRLASGKVQLFDFSAVW